MKSIKGFYLSLFWVQVLTGIVKAFFQRKPLTIDAFYVESLVTIPGSDLDIHWKVSGAFLVRLQPTIGFQKTNGSISIPVQPQLNKIKITAYGLGKKKTALLKVNVLPRPIAHSPRLKHEPKVLNYSEELNKSKQSEKFYSGLQIKGPNKPEIVKEQIAFPKQSFSSKPHFVKDSTASLYKYQNQNISELDQEQAN